MNKYKAMVDFTSKAEGVSCSEGQIVELDEVVANQINDKASEKFPDYAPFLELVERKKQTVADIKKALEEKGIDYPSKATKEELLALLVE
ncbi:hypothetical protein K3N62_07820 [Streptococcus dysgalactiae subsp. dysgalactiae]|uniref:HeH/LEM domain-containing protein n=1 Tax=Streptococcus dysgalactiae TaxID=1334 RepID=UPI001CF316D8|nr:HeH/LEM domain-containing protein [Streptococcus dysgalactiae]MCB2830010.1 hypothetical protein [Streptococcus dysgalactiae subsp. dysgalactiae]MCB2843802.1 hypothetical protein [Streptococcus dysgalactiae subsp. dysgalactiae]MCB2847361.1 hypothetical protein [Streptococcus dysgalactiae subsp. dysgalactiae]MCB2851071.1 hypothetical protein [Streptococcus dysgalactiae subsp. dysgalactiae]